MIYSFKIRLAIIFCFTLKGVYAQNMPEVAKQFYNNGDYDKAESIYRDLYHSKDGMTLYYDDFKATLLKQKKYDEAEKIINKKIKENPKYKLDLGQLYLEKGNVAEAEKIFDAYLQKMPASDFNISEVANMFYSINNYDYAIKTFLIGRRLLKDESVFYNELISLYRFKKNKDGLTNEVLNLVESNPEFLFMAKSNLSRTYENDDDYHILKSLLLKRIQKDPQNTAYIDLLAWQYIQQKQYEMALTQLISLDKRMGDNGGRVFALSEILVENKAYTTANKAYEYLMSKGANSPYFISARIASLQNKNKQIVNQPYQTSDIETLVKDYETLLNDYGRNYQTVFAIRELAHLKAFYLNQLAAAVDILEPIINAPGIEPQKLAQLKLDLADIYLLNVQPWEAALLYGQVEKSLSNEPLGQEAKFKNAKLSFYNGDFNWAKAQLDVLKASTSQLIANDALDLSLLIQDNLAFDSTGNALKIYARADLLQFKNLNQKAIETLDSIPLLYPQSDLVDDILILKSKIFTQQKEFKKAVEVLNTIINNYNTSIWADNALFKIALLEEEQLNDLPNAQKHYQQLLDKFPGSLFATEARKRFRNLRGDAL